MHQGTTHCANLPLRGLLPSLLSECVRAERRVNFTCCTWSSLPASLVLPSVLAAMAWALSLVNFYWREGKPLPIVLFSPATTTQNIGRRSPHNHSSHWKHARSSSKVFARAMSDDSSFRERLKRVIGRGKRDSAKSKAQDGSPKHGAVSSTNSTQGIAHR
jgi:hypothetical protein